MEYVNVDLLRANLEELVVRSQGKTRHFLKGHSHLATQRLLRSIILAALRSLRELDIGYLFDRLVRAAEDNVSHHIEFQEVSEIGAMVLATIAEFLEEKEEQATLQSLRPVINALNNERTRYELQVRFNRITQKILSRQVRELTLLARVNLFSIEDFLEDHQSEWDNLLENLLEILGASDGVIFLRSPFYTVLTMEFSNLARNPQLLPQAMGVMEKLSGRAVEDQLVKLIRRLHTQEPAFNPSLTKERVLSLIEQYHPGTEELNVGRPLTNLDLERPNPLLAFCEVSSYINILIAGEHVDGLILVVKDRPPLLTDEDYAFVETLKNNLKRLAENVVFYHQLQYLTITDPLTEVYNRRHFDEVLRAEVNRALRYDSPLSLAMIDIDHFKQFNDTYGHLVGDQVLRHVAKLLRGNLRASEIIARYGGEEFAILMPETTLDSAIVVGEKIRRVVEENPVVVEGKPLGVTISVGVSSLPEVADDAQQLVETADQALYAAKEQGRNRVISYPELKVEEEAHG